MKKACLYSAVLLAALLGGCGFTDTPNELMRAPTADGDQKSINQAVMQFLPPGSQLTVPLHPSEASAVTLQDLTGDGNPEVVAFFKTEKTDYEIGVLVLSQKQGNWAKLASFTGIGSELDYVTFEDLNGDQLPEMLIGLGGGENLNKELSVYSITQGQVQELIKQPYSVMAVGDLTGNGLSDLALVLHDHNNFTSKVDIYGAKDGKLAKLTELPLEGAINGYEQAIIGKASPTQNGLFIEAGLGAHSASTELLVWDEGKLHNPLAKIDGEMDLTFKPYSLYSEDINGDGIIEIGVTTQPPGTDDLSMAEIPWVSSYFQWDQMSGLKPIEEHYQNFLMGYDFRIPDKWEGKYTITSSAQDPNSMLTRFFFYADNGKTKAELLTLQTVPTKEWAKFESMLKQKQVPYIVLKEATKQVLVAIQPQVTPNLGKSAKQEYKSLLLTPDEVRKHYKPVSMPM